MSDLESVVNYGLFCKRYLMTKVFDPKLLSEDAAAHANP